MVSSNEAGFNLRESMLLPRNILHAVKSGSRIHEAANEPDDCKASRLIEFREASYLNQRLRQANLIYPVSIRDTAKSGIGCFDNRHLNYFAKVILMNVGDSLCNVKAGSQPMSRASVGATIVVRDRESLSHGEGSQSVGTSRAKITEC